MAPARTIRTQQLLPLYTVVLTSSVTYYLLFTEIESLATAFWIPFECCFSFFCRKYSFVSCKTLQAEGEAHRKALRETVVFDTLVSAQWAKVARPERRVAVSDKIGKMQPAKFTSDNSEKYWQFVSISSCERKCIPFARIEKPCKGRFRPFRSMCQAWTPVFAKYRATRGWNWGTLFVWTSQ